MKKKLKNSTTRRCPNCKYYLESFEEDYLAIGSPLVECSKCSRMVILTNINEWELLDLYDRVSRMLIHISTCFFWGFAFALLLPAISLTINHVSRTPVISNEVFKIIVITSSAVSVF